MGDALGVARVSYVDGRDGARGEEAAVRRAVYEEQAGWSKATRRAAGCWRVGTDELAIIRQELHSGPNGPDGEFALIEFSRTQK
jgi:hypothetical protein